MDTHFDIVPYASSLAGECPLSELLLIIAFSLFLFKASLKLDITGKIFSKHIQSLDAKEDQTYKAYKSLPGPRPFPLKLIGNSFMLLPNINIPQKLVQLTQTYGPYYRLTLLNEDFVVLNSPSAAQALLGSTDHRHFRRGEMLERLWPAELESLLIWPGGDKWKKRRRMLSRPFMTRALQRHNSCWHRQCAILVSKLGERFKDFQNDYHSVVDLLRQTTFGMSSETLMGVDIVQEAEDGALFCESLEKFNKIWYNRIFRPWLLVEWIWRRSSDFRKAKALAERLQKVTYKVIQKYKEQVNIESDVNGNDDDDNDDLRKNTMIEAMLRNGVDEKRIFDEVAVMLGVANDTTPLSAEFALFMLALHPEHQERCRQEIDKVFNDPNKFQNGILEFEALKELKYLERCIQESLRIHPLTLILRRLEAPLRINEELIIPKHVSVLVAPYAIHHLPQYYPNPEKYDPDRFLPKKMKERHQYSYLPFSAGPRNCIGLKLAMIELQIMLATILRSFEIKTPDKIEDIKLVVEGSIRPATPIRFTLTKRK